MITESLGIKYSNGNYIIFEIKTVKDQPSLKDKSQIGELKEYDLSYSGTLYQALQNAVRAYYDINSPILEQFQVLSKAIDEKEKEIKKKFSTIVKCG
jgi:Holliday junction resolvase